MLTRSIPSPVMKHTQVANAADTKPRLLHKQSTVAAGRRPQGLRRASRLPWTPSQAIAPRACAGSAAGAASDNAPLKASLRARVAPTDGGAHTEPQLQEKIEGAICALEACPPIARPLEDLGALCKSWRMIYSNVPLTSSNLDMLSFYVFESQAIKVDGVRQVVRPDGSICVMWHFESDEGVRGELAVRGRWKAHPSNPQRMVISFQQVNLSWQGSPKALQAWDQKQGTTSRDGHGSRCIHFERPMASWSDVSYLDNDMRIARANFGLTFVMNGEADTLGDAASLSEQPDVTKKASTTHLRTE